MLFLSESIRGFLSRGSRRGLPAEIAGYSRRTGLGSATSRCSGSQLSVLRGKKPPGRKTQACYSDTFHS